MSGSSFLRFDVTCAAANCPFVASDDAIGEATRKAVQHALSNQDHEVHVYRVALAESREDMFQCVRRQGV